MLNRVKKGRHLVKKKEKNIVPSLEDMISTNAVYVGYLDSFKWPFLKQPYDKSIVFLHFRGDEQQPHFSCRVNFLRFLYCLCPKSQIVNIC